MPATRTDTFPAVGLLDDPVGLSFEPAAVRVVDLFDAWVFAARDTENALGAWSVSDWGERADAFAVYRAALEREERAAALLRLGVSAAAVRDRFPRP